MGYKDAKDRDRDRQRQADRAKADREKQARVDRALRIQRAADKRDRQDRKR